MVKLTIKIVLILAISAFFSRRTYHRPEPVEKAKPWQEWTVFFLILASLYLTMYAARGGFGK